MIYSNKFDVIIIGGGHAGIEAANISSKMGSKTLLLTQNIETIGKMSCNPAIGGIGKSHLVKEIDALGGIMAKAIDRSRIQIRILNSSKGPAVRSTRAQADKQLYQKIILSILKKRQNLVIFQQEISDLIIDENTIKGVKTKIGISFIAKTVILSVGTFLDGKTCIGFNKSNQKKINNQNPISKKLKNLSFNINRLKTGTPPRIDIRSINISKMKIQTSKINNPFFSYFNKGNDNAKKIQCYVTNTNELTHKIILENIQNSSIINGCINGIGPRYCPSIEEKIIRFKNKNSHQIFVEPEGLNSFEIYPNGISTSLSFDLQIKFIKSIKGFENALITKPGYAIEYDFFDPKELKKNLETKKIKNLFFAGQINGTTGYEEAAAQGIIAGINASLTSKNKKNWTPKKENSYIGVLIEDLVTKGTKEPYRMFTSRTEYRLTSREDNADMRLYKKSIILGLLNKKEKNKCLIKNKNIIEEIKHFKYKIVNKKSLEKKTIDFQIFNNKKTKDDSKYLFKILKNPKINIKIINNSLKRIFFVKNSDILKQIEILSKYSGYINRQIKIIIKIKSIENIKIPTNFNYKSIKGLSNEIKNKWMKNSPLTLKEASKIEGITPSAISLLMINIKKSI